MQPPEDWIDKFSQRVCQSIRLFDEETPIGCHYFQSSDLHEITLFLAPTEIVGGPYDGKQILARFLVDLVDLFQNFDEVHDFSWQPQVIDADDEVGAHVALEGQVSGHLVLLRILGEAPNRFLPGRTVNSTTRQFINLWSRSSADSGE